MSMPTFQTPAPLPEEYLAEEDLFEDDEPEPQPVEKCRSLKRTTLHRDGSIEVYIRCEATAGHTGRNHRSWIRKWKTEEADGWLEDEQ